MGSLIEQSNRDRITAAFGLGVRRFAATIRGVATPRRSRGSDRIAVLCDSFIRYGSAQAIGLKAAGADVVFYYVDRLGEFDGNADDRRPYLERVAAAGIAVVALPQRRMLDFPRQTWRLHRDLGRRGVGLLLVQAHIDPRYATLAFRFPVAMIIHDPRPHSGDYESSYPLPVRGLARFAEVTSTCVFLHSELLVEQLFPILRGLPAGVFPHGADMAAAPAAVSPHENLVLVGRLMEYKGIDTALDAFRLVRESHPEARLVLAGRGNMGEHIRSTSPAGVELHDGYIPDEELDELIANARLILLPYKDATQSGVGLVAVAQGIPCIVTRTGALPDLVPPGRGDWVVPVGDHVALAAAISASLGHSDDVRREVFDYASEHFAWPVVGQAILSELQRLGVLDVRVSPSSAAA